MEGTMDVKKSAYKRRQGGKSDMEALMCKIFNCDHRRGNYCCAVCPKPCKNRCQNDHWICGNSFLKSQQEKKKSEKIAELYNTGLSDNAIGKALDVDPKSIYKWRKYRGLQANRDKKMESVKGEAVFLFKSGLTLAEIVERIGFTKDTIRKWVKEAAT